ncbi:MAG: hypothetical protein JXB49_08060 [Bacteroidales bacterium]|nr:hypothetical protein [Bacteroidales bacterium]
MIRLIKVLVFVTLYMYVLFFMFSCSSATHLYIGEWKSQPHENGWVNLRHQLYIEFPDYEWNVFICPDYLIKKMNIEWPQPDYNNKNYTVLISVEVGNSPKKLMFKLDTAKHRAVDLEIFPLKNELPFRGIKEEKTFFQLKMFEISEQTEIEEFSAYFWDTFNKCIKDDIWLQEHNLKNYTITETEDSSISLNNRNCIQKRYRIQSSTDDDEPILILLVFGFKINNKIVFAEFVLKEEEYRYRIEKCYHIVNTIRNVTSEQEFFKLTGSKCHENELLIRTFSTRNYDEAIKTRDILINRNENSDTNHIHSRKVNEEMICIRADDLISEMKDVVQRLEINQISNIIKVHSMYYIVQRLK